MGLLRENARTSVVTLAKKLRLSRSTVNKRIARLEQENIILGYTLKQKAMDTEQAVRAIINIEVKGQDESVRKTLRNMPFVTTLYATNGAWDLIAVLQTPNLEQLDMAISAIRKIDGVTNSQTHILLSLHKV